MILIALLLISIMFFLALVALYISFMIGIELNEENEAAYKRIDELDKELKFQIGVNKTLRSGLEHFENKTK